MARTNLKRKGGFLSPLAFKKRKRSYKKRGKRNSGNRANVSSWTAQTGVGKGIRPKSKKLSAKKWRSILWRDTLAKTHYRTNGTGVTNIISDTTAGQGLLLEVLPTFVGAPGPTTVFWTTAGGLVPPDTGAAVPTFGTGDMVIRGGQIGIAVTCPDAVTDECVLRLWVVALKSRPDRSILPATVSYGSQPDAAPEFNSQYGKIIDYKEATLNNSYPSFTYVRRLRVSKIDQEVYGTILGGPQIAFLVSLVNMQDTTANTMVGVTWHDMSFSADAIT